MWQALWDHYKEARDAFWEDYQKRKDQLQDQLDEAYRSRRKAKNAEWLVDPKNRRSSIGSIIFAGIYLHRFGGSEQFDACIEDLRHQQELLRKEAQEFKTHSRQAVDVLKTKNLPLEAYTDALALMQEMAEDINSTGLSAVEYWAKQYQLRMPGTKSLEEVLKGSRD